MEITFQRSCRWLACVLVMLLGGCARESVQLVAAGPVMGTAYTVKVVDAPQGFDQAKLEVLLAQVWQQIDTAMSGYRADSEVSRFNAALSTDWIDVSAEFVEVVDFALQVSERSGGAFDITVGPLVAAWGFGPDGEPSVLPDTQELERLLASVGHQYLQVRLHPPALRKLQPALQLDLNAVAPGFAVDIVGERLRAAGVNNFMIDLGGEILTAGRAARGGPWRIAVERPEDAPSQPYAILQLSDMAVTTSGEYRHYFDRDGQRYSHTIDPRSGHPLTHALASVVVVAESSMQTDAWTTAFNVLGPEAGLALARQLDMAALFIERREDGLHSLMTPGFERHLEQQP